MEILHRFNRFASFAPQNDMFLEMLINLGRPVFRIPIVLGWNRSQRVGQRTG